MDKNNFGMGRVARFLATLAFALAAGSSPVRAGTVVIDDYFDPDDLIYSRGQVLAERIDDDGDANTDDVWVSSKPPLPRMFIGQSTPGFDDIYNAFLVFDLAPVLNLSVTAATLRLELVSYSGNDPFEDISIHEVTTPLNKDDYNLLRVSWDQEPESYPIFLDLQDTTGGAPFGTARVEMTDPMGTILDISLSPQAVAAINDAGGLFALGIHLDTLSQTDGSEEGLRFSDGTDDYAHQLVLTTNVPDGGATLGMLSLGCLGCAAIARGRRRM